MQSGARASSQAAEAHADAGTTHDSGALDGWPADVARVDATAIQDGALDQDASTSLESGLSDSEAPDGGDDAPAVEMVNVTVQVFETMDPAAQVPVITHLPDGAWYDTFETGADGTVVIQAPRFGMVTVKASPYYKYMAPRQLTTVARVDEGDVLSVGRILPQGGAGSFQKTKFKVTPVEGAASYQVKTRCGNAVLFRIRHGTSCCPRTPAFPSTCLDSIQPLRRGRPKNSRAALRLLSILRTTACRTPTSATHGPSTATRKRSIIVGAS